MFYDDPGEHNLRHNPFKALVAFSGGVDSALVLQFAVQELGDRAVALTAISASVAPDEADLPHAR